MKKEEFNEILLHYTNSSPEEAQEIIALKNAFPFSQLLHALAARVSKDHAFGNHQGELQLAAIYAADRAVLKEIITKPSEQWPSSMEVDGLKHSETPPSIIYSATAPGAPAMDVADELMKDLKRLNELKHGFEVMFSHDTTSAPTRDRDTETADSPPENSQKPTLKKKKSTKTKAQRIVELAQGLHHHETSADTHEGDEPIKGGRQEGTEGIIEEIASSKKKIVPESRKQKEQLEIIEQFIKAQPSISNQKDKAVTAPQGDLSTIKSGEFGDNVISETLVDILLKQGKKDKAIEVLKKLIWKFPQKKAYFAAQIEELKK